MRHLEFKTSLGYTATPYLKKGGNILKNKVT
jgi:hypothetical protein